MKYRIGVRIICTVLLLCLQESVALFFNNTSPIELKPFNISKGFVLTFKTCDGGPLLRQNGTGTDYFELHVVQGSMNHTSLVFTQSTLVLKWKVASKENSVNVGNELDQNKPHQVSFLPRVKNLRNTTLSVSAGSSKLSTVHVSDSILDIVSSGNMIIGSGFIGCVDFGSVFNISMDSVNTVLIPEECPLNAKPSCERKKCPDGFKGYYCELNIDDCAVLPCHHASKCIDKIANYTCECGAGWYGRNCDKLKDDKLCDLKPCNGGICYHVSDYNNYTCKCPVPYTGRNCSKIMDPCENNPCFNNGTCKNITETYFQCDCPQGFRGKRCEVNIDDCARADCGSGMCVDGISSYSCNCTGSGFNGSRCEKDINECDSSPCVNGGTCSNYGGGYTCKCKVGYTGKNCESNIDDCAGRPCKNGGNCTDSLNDFFCHCPLGFTGKSCQSKLHRCNVDKNCSACDVRPCQNGRCNCTCSLYNVHYNCTCNQGYRGVDCADDIDECAENSSLCYNNGTCRNKKGGFSCECPQDYTGKYCNETKSICHPNPCKNGGYCTNISATSYNCSCSPGWTGSNCTEDIDECSLRIDMCNKTTGSVCRNNIGGYVCECGSGYTGTRCDDDIDECKTLTPCLHNGKCVNNPGSYFCFCLGYTGENCSIKINYCLQGGDKDCKNGSCKNGEIDFKCICDVGWDGKFCTDDIDECAPRYCQNNATCQHGLGNYTCTCQPGYTDHNCSTDIDECASNPCKNNGVCKDQVADYKCNCSAGYTGKSCDIDIDWCDEARNNGSQPCGIYGNCTDHLLNYTCDCFAGFVGLNCATDVDECADNPCQNGATCIQKSNDTAILAQFGKTYPPKESGGYVCICMPGYNGRNCETDIDECEVYKPCNSTGTKMCNDSVGDYNCTCNTGFTGRNCSVDINECASDPCLNNGTCRDLPGLFSCVCDSNHTGVRCENRVDPCTALTPCRNGGTCVEQAAFNFTCSCAPGFAGNTCSDETTLGFDGTTLMTLRIGEGATTLNVSFSFQTIFPSGVLVSESNKWMVALKSGYLEVLGRDSVLFTLGSGSSFSDSRWHTVSVVVSDAFISARVNSSTCVERCSNRTELPPAVAAAASSGTRLVVGGTSMASGRTGFVGSIRDFAVNDLKYYPGVSGVNASNVITGFQRRNVCSPDPCGHGTCKDLWTKYACDCDRKWTAVNCTEVVQWGTFGVISRLKNGYNSTGNRSYVKYSRSSSSFTSLVFSMRTRSQSSVVVLLYSNASVCLSIETSNGYLRLRNNNKTIDLGAVKVDDSLEHYVSINRSAIQIDNTSDVITLPSFPIEDVFVGGIPEDNLPMALGGPFTAYRGCILDVRLNGEQLLFFDQAVGRWNRTQKNVASNCSSEDVCGKLSGRATCSNRGNCSDLWNQYRCDCPWPYGGDTCELYGCEWTNLCPGNATCVNVKSISEYECIAQATFNGSQSSVSFANSSQVSSVQSLVAQFRTRQNSSSILTSFQNGSFFEITIQDGRLVVSYNLTENLTEAINTNVFVSDGKWHELKLESNVNETKFTISPMELLGAGTPRYSPNITLLRNRSILNQAFMKLVSTADVHLGSPFNKTQYYLVGCLREIRIGGYLLSFVENLTDTKPGFSHAVSPFRVRNLRKNFTYGCPGNPVCTSSLCGAGTCADLWNKFSCACPKSYHGDLCEYSPCSPASPCMNGACAVTNDTFRCTCPSDYAGELCNESCAASPCENGGVCSVREGELACACEADRSGRFCETVVARSGDDDDNLPMIIGLSVAGGCLLLIIIFVIFVCTRQTSSTFGTYSPSGEEKLGSPVEMNPVFNVPPPEKLI